MKRLYDMRILGLLAIGFVWMTALSMIGCERDMTVTSEIVSITPTDGATSVLKTTLVELEFSEPMEAESCQSRFGLFDGEQDIIPEGMMGRMDGQFSWNGDGTIMTFHPDSTLMDSTMYSICLQEGMMTDRNQGGSMMIDGMMGYGSRVNNGIISKFTTE